MAGIAGRHHAIKKIHSPGYALNNIAGRTHAHEVSGLVGRHIRLYRLNYFVHGLCGLPYRQAANGVAVTIQLGNLLHVPDAKVRKSGPLIDAKEQLPGIYCIRQAAQPVMLLFAPLQPPQCALTAGLGVFIGCRVFHALVKGHGDVRA